MKRQLKKSHIWATLALAAAAVTAMPAAAQAADATGPVTGIGGKCLDVRGGRTDSGTPVQLYRCNGTDSQKWTYSYEPGRAGSPLVAFGKCLDVASGGTADHTPVRLWDCNGSGAQTWVRVEGGALLNPRSNKCLDVPGSSTADGTPLQIYSCNYSPAQVWNFPTGSSGRPSVDELKKQVMQLVNDYRAQNGKAALTYDSAVEHTAQDEADEEARRQQQGHWTYDGTFNARLKQYGYSRQPGATGENAAGAHGFWTDARSVVQAWIGDQRHRDIMLGDYAYTGVGLVIDANGTYWWAQDFVG
ncbi:ricin-type beta-trefoil lectin domain protein [Streptomyces morookaense]|uniref:CAP domain-containing protein n=1 Tax=Streptomyces morookaense TaxID=1970 RepID=UPI0033C090F7